MWIRYWPYGEVKGEPVGAGVVLKLMESWDDERGNVISKETLWVDNGAIRWVEMGGNWLGNFEFESKSKRTVLHKDTMEEPTSRGRHRWWLEGITLKRRSKEV